MNIFRMSERVQVEIGGGELVKGSWRSLAPSELTGPRPLVTSPLARLLAHILRFGGGAADFRPQLPYNLRPSPSACPCNGILREKCAR